MPELPDRFDLLVRQARMCPDPARQLDYILGSLVALPEWFFVNLGLDENVSPAEAEIDGEKVLLVFSDAQRTKDIMPALPVITMPSNKALPWCLERGSGLLVNPGENSALVPRAQLEIFHTEWLLCGAALKSGFWIPLLTTEEEDFWQQHGL